MSRPMEVASGHFVLNTFQMLPIGLKRTGPRCFGAFTQQSLKIQVRGVLIFGTVTANLLYKVHLSHLQIYLHSLIFNLLKMLLSDFCLPFCQNCSLVINTAPNNQVLILELLFEVSYTASLTYFLQLAFRSAPSFLDGFSLAAYSFRSHEPRGAATSGQQLHILSGSVLDNSCFFLLPLSCLLLL